MAYKLAIPDALCAMEYGDEPTPEFVARFTQQKQLFWGRVTSSIDDYIREEIEAHIDAATGMRSSALNHVRSGNYRASLKSRIDNQVNRGLAIIAVNPDVKIIGDSPYTIIDREVFEQAMRGLLGDFGNYNKRGLNLRVAQSVRWVDACAFQVLFKVSASLTRKWYS